MGHSCPRHRLYSRGSSGDGGSWQVIRKSQVVGSIPMAGSSIPTTVARPSPLGLLPAAAILLPLSHSSSRSTAVLLPMGGHLSYVHCYSNNTMVMADTA